MSFPMPTLDDIKDLLQSPSEPWDSVHPSQVTCPRFIFYKLHRYPEIPNAYRDLAGITFVGTALHEALLPRLADYYRRHNYLAEVEVDVEGELEGLLLKGRIDLLVTNPINQEKSVVDLKFVHPNAIYKLFPHHLHQVALYCYLTQATHAALLYFARDLQSLTTWSLTQEDLERSLEEVRALLRSANVADEEQLPPPLHPGKFPCRYTTQRGSGICPFFYQCHPHTTADPDDHEQEVSAMVSQYLQLRRDYEEQMQYLKATEAQLSELEDRLKSYLQPQKPYTVDEGTVVLKESVQWRVDTKQVERLLHSLQIEVPKREVVIRRLEVQFS